MSYRCAVCREVVPAGTPRQVHVEYREVPAGLRPDAQGRLQQVCRREVACELAVCPTCKRRLDKGQRLGQLLLRSHPGVHVAKAGPPRPAGSLLPPGGTGRTTNTR